MIEKSPFTLHRFEHQQEQLYYLPVGPFSLLEQPKSLFIIGSRGTGKTTLLQALNWREQLFNAALQQKLVGSISDRKYIGIYVKVPLMHVPAFDRWSEAPAVLETLFSLYLDLVWLEELGNAIATMIDKGVLRARPKQETSLVSDILALEPVLLGKRSPKPITIRQLSQLFHSVRRELETLVVANARISPKHLSERFPMLQFGELGRNVSSKVSTFCENYCNNTTAGAWHFRVCMDEAECLSERQQRILNSMVRLATPSLSYVISYVSPREQMSVTSLPNLTLQIADRTILRLDEMSDQEFHALCVGVASVRLAYVAQHDVTFDLAAILGKLSINQLLQSILSLSVSKDAKELLASAERLRAAPFVNTIQDTNERNLPPIYQAYLVKRLNLTLPAPDTPQWRRRNQESAAIRKKMVAAYLCICNELSLMPRYASERMLFQMSDKCIRDFLAQMDGLFTERGVSVDEFVNTMIPLERQDKALRKVSTAKHEFILSSGVSSPNETLWLVDALGELTARLHTGPTVERALQSTERGIFVLALPHDASLEHVARVIREAADAGFLKLIDSEDSELRFRVHCSLAAHFGFSYRGSYYPVPIKGADLGAIYKEVNLDKRNRLIVRIADSLNGTEETPPLFGGQI